MSVWMAAKQTLTAMDLVTREWASALGLDECGVMVLILLAERPSRPAHDLAMYCGRARQQVQRSLRLMQQQDVVCPAKLSDRGRVTAWTLTERGVALWKCLEPGLEEWDEYFDRILDVHEFTRMLRRVSETMVNRPGADGWRRGLLVPHDLLLTPLKARLELAGLIPYEDEAPTQRPLDESELENRPGDELLLAELNEILAARAELEKQLNESDMDPRVRATLLSRLEETAL